MITSKQVLNNKKTKRIKERMNKEHKEICPFFSECRLNPGKALCHWVLDISPRSFSWTDVEVRGANDGCLLELARNPRESQVIESKINFIKSKLEHPGMKFYFV